MVPDEDTVEIVPLTMRERHTIAALVALAEGLPIGAEDLDVDAEALASIKEKLEAFDDA